MDRKAFKQRMQELKSYREQNPGKGYLDWKASKYAEGGETPPTKYRGGYDKSGNIVVPVTNTVHEMNHYVDFLKNKSPHADANSNMFYKMSEDMGGVRIDDDDLYYSRPTEQKAYMNQLREYMFENGDIARRGDRVSKDLLQKTLDRLKGNSKYDSVIRASKQFGNMTKYTKWFNSIPLLGIGALGVNKYFVNNEGGNYDFRQER